MAAGFTASTPRSPSSPCATGPATSTSPPPVSPGRPPSPNLKSPAANILYPGVGLTEQTNISVGRGTPAPFENLGAPWINAKELASYLTARGIPGIDLHPHHPHHR